MTRGRTGPYLLQAAIADLYLQEPRDWQQIAALYAALARQTGSPVVEMNRAVAVAETDGPEASLAVGEDAGQAGGAHRGGLEAGQTGDLLAVRGDDQQAAGAPQPASGAVHVDGEGGLPAGADRVEAIRASSASRRTTASTSWAASAPG
jgi:predicted RNA polymerase sigma factor